MKTLGTDASLLALFLRGVSLYKAGKIEDAAGQFRAAIKMSPDFLPGVFYLGVLLCGRRQDAAGRGRVAGSDDRG